MQITITIQCDDDETGHANNDYQFSRDYETRNEFEKTAFRALASLGAPLLDYEEC